MAGNTPRGFQKRFIDAAAECAPPEEVTTMKILTRLAMMIGLGVAATIASTSPASAGDWGVSVHGGGWNNGWAVSYHDRDRHRGYGNGYGYNRHYRQAPRYYAPYRPYYAPRSYSHSHRDPWCRTHRAYHVHGRRDGYRGSYYQGYRDGRYDRSDYGSSAYYDRIDEMSYDTSYYYGRRW
jgi:hypothetical protein